MLKNDADDILTSGPAARIIGFSTEALRQVVRAGNLRAMRTAGGVLLFKRSDVERFAAERQARLKEPAGAAR